MFRAAILTLLILNYVFSVHATDNKTVKEEDVTILSTLEDRLDLKLGEYTNFLTQWLARFNDKRLGGDSELGRFLHYDEIKPKIEEAGKQGRSIKKSALALIPLIFHVGATSTWMLITTLLAAKSVAIGMLLLIFKIAVSSAKVASFFTILKGKHLLAHAHHHDWTPHYEHHGHRRSLDSIGHHPTYLEHPPSDDLSSYTPPQSAPEWSQPEPQYKTLSSYKQATDPYEYASESKQVTKAEKKFG